jgi:protease secretion system membrane fusion protein
MAIFNFFKRSTRPAAPAQAEPDKLSWESTPTLEFGRAAKKGSLALGIGFVCFMLWAAFAPLDEGIPSQGSVTLDTKRKSVQHLSGGIIKAVLVGEGEQVKEGQLLIKLDDAAAKANFEAIRQRYLGLLTMQGRLLAEQAGDASITFHPDLLAESQDPLIKQQMVNQERLFVSRKAALSADLQGIEESIQGQRGLSVAYKQMQDSRNNQQALLQEELGHTRALVAEGYAPRNRQLELERQVSETITAISELQGNTVRAIRATAELQQRATARKQEYRKEVESQLADVTREALSDSSKFSALKDDLARTEIRSPASGQVVALATQTVGGVISPGQKLLDVVPENESLLLETRVQPHLIDSVRTGMPVDIRFSSFAHSPQLVVQGQLVSVSGDLLTDPSNGMTYYLARVAVTPEGLTKLGKRQMQPGMPVEVILRTGERSMLTYLLHPLTKRIAASMNEE